MLDKTTAAVDPLRKKIKVGPGGGNEACNGGKSAQKTYLPGKGKNKNTGTREKCPIGTALSVGTLLV